MDEMIILLLEPNYDFTKKYYTARGFKVRFSKKSFSTT